MKKDFLYLRSAENIAQVSPCHSRQFGTVLVGADGHVISRGYNTPLYNEMFCKDSCPRQKYGYLSGHGLHMCPAIHAEIMCISLAASTGQPTIGGSLYVSGCIPCKDCLMALIQAGVRKIVCKEATYYDDLSEKIIHYSDLTVRTYDLKEE